MTMNLIQIAKKRSESPRFQQNADKQLAEQVARFKYLRPREWFTFWTMKGDQVDSTCHVYETCHLDAMARAKLELGVGYAQLHFEGCDD